MHTTIGAGFATDHDRPVRSLVPPVVVESGRADGFQVTDQIYRGTRFVGRFASSGLAGFKVIGTGRGVRVRVRLSIDNKAIAHWRKQVGGSSADSRLPRLIQIRSQGLLRQCVVLDSRASRKRPYAMVEFDLSADELSADGLLCVEAVDATEWYRTSPRIMSAVHGRIAPSSVTGIRIDRVEFDTVPVTPGSPAPKTLDGVISEEISLISAGGMVHGRKSGARKLDMGIVVVNPMPPSPGAAAAGRVRLRLGVRLTGLPKDNATRPARRGKGRLARVEVRAWRMRRKMRRRTRGVLSRLTTVGYGLAARIRHVEIPAPLVLNMEDGRRIPVSLRREGRRDLRLEFLAPLSSPALVVMPADMRFPGRLRLSLVSVARLSP